MRGMNFRLRTLFAYTLLTANVLAYPMMMARVGFPLAISVFCGFSYLAGVVATGRWRWRPPA
jgi:hypothetical protein